MSATNGVAVRLDDVRKTYANEFAALRGVSLAVEPGEWLVLVGPSGCGKTTTLRVIAGLEQPDRGTIHIGGQDVCRVPPWRRGAAMVFQRPALAPTHTVRQNLIFGLSEPHNRDVGAMAEMLGLAAELDRLPHQLSGGQQQRVALGRALARQAPLCLLDEPLGQLDAPLRADLRRELKRCHRRWPATMISVTHDPAEAWALADRIAIMDQGIIVQTGAPAEIRRQPCNRFVAAFFAEVPMNFFAGTLRRQGNLLQWTASPWTQPIPCEQELADGQVAMVGIRASDVHAGAPGAMTMKAAVVQPTPLGAWVSGEIEGQSLTAWATAPIQIGDTVGVTMDWTQMFLFDVDSGATLSAPKS